MENRFKGYRKLSLRELQLLQLNAMKHIHQVCLKHNIKYYMIGGTLLGAVRHKGFIPWDDDIDIAMMREDYERFKQIFASEFDLSRFFLQHYDSDIDFRPAMLRVCIKNTIQDYPSEIHHKCCKNTYVDIFPLDNVPDSELERDTHIKELLNIDRLINIKLYHIYEQNSKLYVLFKRIVSKLLFDPLKTLQKKRIKSMTKYKDVSTKCVASTVSKYGYRKQIMDRNIYGNPVLYDFEDTQLFGVEQVDVYLTQLFGKKYMEIPPENKREVPHDVYIKETTK